MEKGSLNVDGGNHWQYIFMDGGGAGGIIQIITSEGAIVAGTLSLKGGNSGSWCSVAANGYFFVQGPLSRK